MCCQEDISYSNTSYHFLAWGHSTDKLDVLSSDKSRLRSGNRRPRPLRVVVTLSSVVCSAVISSLMLHFFPVKTCMKSEMRFDRKILKSPASHHSETEGDAVSELTSCDGAIIPTA